MISLQLIFHTATACAEREIPFGFFCASTENVREEARKFLLEHMPPTDFENSIDDRIVNNTIESALRAKKKFPWAKSVSKQDFFRYVLPYVETNEPRTNWRELFEQKVASRVPVGTMRVIEILAWLNGGDPGFLWRDAFAPLTFQPDRTPEVFDPLSLIAFRGASCTGVSIFFLSALRSLGIPARVAGTPAWNGKDEGTSNNHSWLEILIDGEWHFTEAKPLGSGSPDDIYNPCDKSFCSRRSMTNTTVFASQWDGEITIPLAWAPRYLHARGLDRSVYYQDVCMSCSGGEVDFGAAKI